MQKTWRIVIALCVGLALMGGMWMLTGQNTAIQAVEERWTAIRNGADPDEMEVELVVSDDEMMLRRACYCVMAGLCAMALILCLTARNVKLHWLALWLILLCGGAIIAGCPTGIHTCWDDETHSWLIEPLGYLHRTDLTYFASVFTTWFFGYWPNAIGLAASDIFGLVGADLLVGRISGLVIFAIMSSLAVYITPKYKLTFLNVACMPVVMFLSLNYTYDGAIIASVLLAIAMLMREISTPDEPITPGRMVLMTALLCLGTLPKPAYAPLLFLLWLLPEKKFGSKARLWIMRAMTLAMVALSAGTLMLGAYDTVIGGDARFEGTDSAAQIAHILTHPLTFLGVVARYLWENGVGLFVGSLTHFAFLGDAYLRAPLAILLFVVAPLYAAGETQPSLMTGKRRAVFFISAWIPLLVLIVAQYLASTSVADTTIVGMQARYGLPVLTLMALALMFPEKWRQREGWISRAAVCAVSCTVAGIILWMAWSLGVQPMAAGRLLGV